ncbi:MAG: flagellar basal body rod protein FlgC [Burkholderiaceae bacterium]|jgi:flagellar basal-body rod protein FlgC|nr:flagellar basal body rod protein FlgC [Burkholderiaceae bacterium]
MTISNIFGIAGTALNAQMVRMNATASNLANAGTVASTEAEAFKGKRPVFKALVEKNMTNSGAPYVGGVKVDRMQDDATPVQPIFDPSHPMADEAGYVYPANVNEVTEMVEMMASARSYQNNVEVVNTARQLMLRTLELTRS